MLKLDSNGAPFSPCSDRFCTEGYRKPLTAIETLDRLSEIKGLNGIGLGCPLEFESLDYFKKRLSQNGWGVSTVCPDTYASPEWANGCLMNRDSGIRRHMIDLFKQSMDLAAEFPGSDVLVWLANDGYDYAFEDDYARRWDLLMDAISELCEYRSDVKISLEYKPKEPRIRQYVANYGISLFMCERLKYPNLGIVMDIGHSIIAGENPAEAVAIINKYGRLNHIHLNDNYGSWDDDLIFGSVHFWETLEVFYILNKIGYDGWMSLDIWPSRGDGLKALQESVARAYMFYEIAKKIPKDEIEKLQAENQTAEIMKIIRQCSIIH